MRLLQLEIRGFGRLKGRYTLDVGQGQVALLLEENETGKSTLATAVFATLFGLQSDRRRSRGRLSEQEQFRPWDGGAYAASLVVEHRGEQLLIERDFQEDSVRVLAGSQDVTQRFVQGSRVDVGERLTGLSRSQFGLSAYMGQGVLVWRDGGELGEALQRVTDTDDGGSTAATALVALEEALTGYAGLTIKRGRIDTEIKQCEKRLAEDRQDLMALESRRAELGEEIATVAADGVRSELLEHRQRMLQFRRLQQQRDELRTRLMEDQKLAAEIVALESVCAQETELRSLDTAKIQKVLDARSVWQSQVEASQQMHESVETRKQLWRELVQERDALALRRRPTEEDRQAFSDLVAEMGASRAQRERLQAEVDREQGEIRARGFDVEEAERLALQLEKMDPETRELVHTRTQSIERDREERQRLEAELAQHKRRRAEIRQSQHTRKHFGIWCLVVGLLPVMVAITMHPHLPFAPLILHLVGAAMGVAGVAALLWGQTVGRGEDRMLAPLVAKLRSQLNHIARSEADTERRWKGLASELSIAAENLEERCRSFLSVERRVDTLRRLEDRLVESRRVDEEQTAELRRLWEIFEDEPDGARLAERQSVVSTAIEIYRRLDEAETWMQDEQRRADESRVRIQKALERLHEQLRGAGIEVNDDDEVEGLLNSLRQRAEAATAARDRFERELPAMRSRRLAEREAAAFESQLSMIETRQGELGAEIESGARQGGDFASEVESLEIALSAEEFDELRAALHQREREARASEENERLEARAFLADYERDAPVLRERIEETEVAHRRAQETRDAVTLAHATLSGLAQETHRGYAVRLNARTNELLRALDSEAQDAHFDESLQLRLQQRGKVLSSTDAAAQLSTGALDIVFLAARIAVAQALGAADPLPLVLDDPFANADDRRLVRGVQLLLDAIAPRQQVIIMACQRSRYAWLRSQLSGGDRLVPITAATESNREG